MVKNNISPEMNDEAIRLIEKLDSEGFSPTAVFWLFEEERNTWSLVIAKKNYRIIGPRVGYKMVQDVLLKYPDEFLNISLSDIVLMDETDSHVSLFRSALGRTGKKIKNTRFSQSVIKGKMIDDALIYRL